MDGYQYEEKCAELLKAKGFSDVQVTPGSGDQGIDVIAYQSKKKYGVQCKYYEGTVGNKAIQEVYAGAAYYNCDVALVITNSTLTKPAKELASKLKVEIWENIDAIYLQKHTAEYIEQERALRRKEEERQQQLERRRKQEEQRKRELALKEQEAHKERQQEEAKKVAKLRPRYDYASGLIASSGSHIVVVKPDGTVIATGKNDYGQCNVSGWRDVIAVQCDRFGTVGVTSAGTVYYTGTNLEKQAQCRSWTRIKEVGFASSCVVGLRYDGTVVATHSTNTGIGKGNAPDITTWSGISQLRFGGGTVAGITTDQKLLHVSRNCYQRCETTYSNGAQNVDDAAIGFIGSTLLLKVDGSVSVHGAGLNPPLAPTHLNKQYGIVKIYMSGKRPLAILGDGSIFVEPIPNASCDDFSRFLADNEIKKVVAICADGISVSILTENGKVYWFKNDRFSRTSSDAQPFGTDFRVFSDFHKMMDEKENAERKNREAKEFDEKQRREEEQRRADRRDKELCQYCGGSLKKVLFGMKCTSCGRRKDY